MYFAILACVLLSKLLPRIDFFFYALCFLTRRNNLMRNNLTPVGARQPAWLLVRTALSFGVCLMGAMMLRAQTPADNPGHIVATFKNGRKIHADEFLYAYQKRYGKDTPDGREPKRTVRDALRQYIVFVRKVMQGEGQGLDTTAAFRAEYAGYAQQLRESYLSEGAVLNQLVEEAFRRSSTDIRASHILLALPPNATPADTLYLYRKALALRDSALRQHIPFAELALRHSADPHTASRGGDLGYFSVLDLAYPVENAAFLTPVGEVSFPARSRHGYHLLFVRDKVLHQGLKRAAHILLAEPNRDKPGELDTAFSLAQAQAVMARLRGGEQFAALAEAYSADAMSAPHGGDLGAQRLPPELEAYKYRLAVGSYSEPFLTSQGWHILAVTEELPAPRPLEVRAELKLRIRQDERYAIAQEQLVERLRHDYYYQVHTAPLEALAAELGPEFPYLTRNLLSRLSPALLASPVATFADHSISAYNLLEFCAQREMFLPKETRQALSHALRVLSRDALLRYEESQLANRYPEYNALLREYHDGMLLFALMEEHVWRRASSDTEGLRLYYNYHLKDFRRPPSLRVVRLQTSSLEVMDKLLLQLRSENNPSAGMQVADGDQAGTSTYAYAMDTYVLTDNEPDKLAEFMRHRPGWSTHVVQQPDGSFRAEYYAETLHDGGVVPFEQCRAEVSRLYQQQLEASWARSLAKRYPVKIHRGGLRKIFKKQR